MEEIYQEIEKKVREAGYPKEIDGYEIYNEICDGIEDKEPGSYIFMAKKSEDVYHEYKVDVMEDEFNLSYVDIHDGEKVYHVNFDE